jgi:hypothetical protein
MGLVLIEDIVQFAGEYLLFILYLSGIMFFQKMVDFLDAVAADGKAGVGVINRQIVLVADIDNPFAEAALMLHSLISHDKMLSFLYMNS